MSQQHTSYHHDNTGGGIMSSSSAAPCSPPMSPIVSPIPDGPPPSLSDDVSSLMAQELLQLSFQERQQVLNEIHGVDETIQHQEEDIDMVSTALDDLNDELDSILLQQHAVDSSCTTSTPPRTVAAATWTTTTTAGSEKATTAAVRVTPPSSERTDADSSDNDSDALLEVLQHSSDYVRNPKFLLMFLRADKYDAKLAIRRMINFFTEKKALFGSHTLGRDITLSDMNDDDMIMLQSGYTQILPERDRAGRAVWFSLSHKRRGRSLQSVARTWFYTVMAALEDEETQINGFCNIKYDYGKSSPSSTSSSLSSANIISQHTPTMIGTRDPPDLPLIPKNESSVTYNHCQLFYKLEKAMPFRINALHVCYINPALTDLFNIAVANISKHQRARLRFHYGPHMEIQYELMTFGIKVDCLPINRDGEESLINHYNWIQRRRAKEETETETLIDNYNDNHNLLGKLLDDDNDNNHNRQQQQDDAVVETGEGIEGGDDDVVDYSTIVPLSLSPPTGFTDVGDVAVGKVETNTTSPSEQWPGLSFDSSNTNVSHHRYSPQTYSSATTSDDDSTTNDSLVDSAGGGGSGGFIGTGVYSQPQKLSVIDEQQQLFGGYQPQEYQTSKKTKDQTQRKTQQGKPQKFIAIPKHEDVILGRGNKNHYGNMRFRQIIDSHRQQYESSDKAGKTSISELVVRQVKERGGRFLKNQAAGWVELDDSSARYKVSHRFRNLRLLDSNVGVGGSNHKVNNSNGSKTNNTSTTTATPKRPKCHKIDVTPIAANSDASILSVPISNKRGRTTGASSSSDDQGWFCTPKAIRTNEL